MWKRDLSAGCIGFAAANMLFAMAHYLATPRLVVAVAFVLCAVALMAAGIYYALALARTMPAEASTPSRGRTVVSSVAPA